MGLVSVLIMPFQLLTLANRIHSLYIQFKASMYFFIIPMLLYIFVKSLFIGLGQGSGKTQAVALVVLELGILIAISTMRPYMDKKTNAFNISIAAVNFVNALLLLFFTGVFGLPVSNLLQLRNFTDTL